MYCMHSGTYSRSTRPLAVTVYVHTLNCCSRQSCIAVSCVIGVKSTHMLQLSYYEFDLSKIGE